MSNDTDLPLLRLSPSDFGRALKVVNRTKRFILFIPALMHGGEALVFPRNTRRAGQPIKQGRGVVFFNGVDRAWQAAMGNGEDAIVINDITAEQADALLQKHIALRGQNTALNLDTIKKLLTFAKDELRANALYIFMTKDHLMSILMIESGLHATAFRTQSSRAIAAQ